MKQVQDFTWPSLLKGAIVPPSELPVQPIRELALPPTNLRTDMEECDFGDDEMDKEYTFGKINVYFVIGLNEINSFFLLF